MTLALSTLALASAQAQDAPTCMQRLDAATPDSVRSTFAATVQSFNPRRPLPTPYAELFANGLRQELKIPANVVFPVFEAGSMPTKASPSRTAWMAVPSMSVVFGVTIDAGKISRIRRIAGASGTAFDVAVMNALTMLDSTSALPPLPDALGTEPLEISVAIMRVPSHVVHPVITNPNVPAVPLFLVRSPAFAVSQRAAPGAGFAKFVPQPPTKRDDEAVIVRVTVRPDGVVDQASMQVIAYSSTGYIKSVFDAIPDWKFQPMVLNGCAVPSMEELTFSAAPTASGRPLR